MSLKRIFPALVLALTAVTPLVHAQASIPGGIPGIGAGATSPLGATSALGGTSALAAPAGLTGAAPQSIWGFFGLSKANCAACRAQLCNSQIGMMMNSALGPVSAISGGMIPQFCPTTPSAADIAALEKSGASPAVVAAAKIKADEADAKARVAAVEYLGTVDCNYWPEAQKALLTALRKDRNECVRYAAARVLSNGCCCSKETIRLLTISVMGQGAVGSSGLTDDKEPPETSERVRCAAMIALQTCVSNAPPEREAPLPKDEGPFKPPVTRPEGPGTSPSTSLGNVDGDLARSAFLKTLARKPMSVVVNDARIALQVVGKQEPLLFTTGNRSLMSAIARARKTPKSQPAHSPAAPGAVGLLVSPAPSAAHVHSPNLEMTPPSVPDGPRAGEVSPAPASNPSEPTNLPPLPANNPVEQAPTPSTAPPATPLAPRFEAAPISSSPLTRVVPVDKPVQLPKLEKDYLPPLPPSSTAANLPTAVSGMLPATYRPVYYPQTVARSIPASRPRQDAKIIRTAATSESDAALYEKFRRDPDSFRGDFPR
jgi:hypothetical protein